ncbi:hypothetical protein U9M48_015837 [Paspalum notatum var. saurae]|uniref:Uncharacterized protein n=1 Tax=Paspalum notatum var. saurae TaxID=547442 RepID=A0AAQ3T7M5_PASNO
MGFPGTHPARKLLRGGGSATAGRALGLDLDGFGDIFSNLWQLVKANAAELLSYVAALFSALATKVDDLFPPDTRSEALGWWLHVAVTVVLPAALGSLLLFCLARCCCGRRRARGGRFMAAPGRRGGRMPRGVFEDNPRLYFRDLRAGKPLVY